MSKATLAVKLDKQVVGRVRRFCVEHGIKQGFFVEKALMAQMEREEMIGDLADLRLGRADEQIAIPLDAYLARRKKHA